MKDANPLQAQARVILNAAPAPAPAPQDPRCWGPRRFPPTPPNHPAARSIAYNRDLVPKEAASLSRCVRRRPAKTPPSRSVGQAAKDRTHRASSQASFMPFATTSQGRGTKLGAAGRPGPDPNALTVELDGPRLPSAVNL